MNLRTLMLTSSLLVGASCSRSLEVPPQPAPAPPGKITGTLQYFLPGKTLPQPAAGAIVEVLGTPSAVVARDNGSFELDNLVQTGGRLWIHLKAPGASDWTHQKIIELEPLGFRRGKVLDLGTLSLNQNAEVSGRIRRADLASQAGGHGFIQVVVPGAPFSTFTHDDGSFTLSNLPEGSVHLAFYAGGYDALVIGPVTVTGGATLELTPQSLSKSDAPPKRMNFSGFVSIYPPPEDQGGTTVTAEVPILKSLGALSTVTDSAGGYVLSEVPEGIYDLLAERPGYAPIRIANLLLTSEAAGQGIPSLTLVEGAERATDSPRDGGVVWTLDGGGPLPVDCTDAADAGVPNRAPIARINGQTGVVQDVAPLDGTVQLDATASSDPDDLPGCRRPLSYRWKQVKPDPQSQPIALSVNDSILAVAPRFTLDASFQAGDLIEWSLTATDSQGAASAPVQLVQTVARRPVVRVDLRHQGRPHHPFNADEGFFSSEVTAGAPVEIDASQSVEPTGAPLTYQFAFALPGAGCLERAPTDPICRVPALPLGPASLEVAVTATHALYPKLKDQLSFALKVFDPTDFSASVVAPLTIKPNETLVLTSKVSPASLPYTPGALSYQWSTQGCVAAGASDGPSFALTPQGGVGTVCSVQLVVQRTSQNGNARTATASLYVDHGQSVDLKHQAGQLDASEFGARIEFNKPVQNSNLTSDNWEVKDAQGLPIPISLILSDSEPGATATSRLWLAFATPQPPGSYTLEVNNLRDASPLGTVLNGTFSLKVANGSWSKAWVSKEHSTAQPYPGIGTVQRREKIRRVQSQNGAEVELEAYEYRSGEAAVVMARYAGTACTSAHCAWLAAVDPSQPVAATTPSPLLEEEQVAMGSNTANPQLPWARRAVRVGDKAIGWSDDGKWVSRGGVTVSFKEPVTASGSRIREGLAGTGGWTVESTPPAPFVFSDGQTAYALTTNAAGDVFLNRYAPANGGSAPWLAVPPVPVVFGGGSTANPPLVAGAVGPAGRFGVVFASPTSSLPIPLYASRFVNGGFEFFSAQPFTGAATGGANGRVRLGWLSSNGVDSPVVARWELNQSFGLALRTMTDINATSWDFPATPWPNQYGGFAGGCDLATRGDIIYLACSWTDVSAGAPAQLLVARGQYGSSSISWTSLPGPGGTAHVNGDAACSAEQPELALGQEGLWLTWAENCLGRWYLRARVYH